MKRLTHKEYVGRLARRNPQLVVLEPYCKANIALRVRCRGCGNVLVREANSHLRFGCMTCFRRLGRSPHNQPADSGGQG